MPVDKPTKEQLDYWEKILHDYNLGMERGRGGKAANGKRRLVTVGTSNDLESVEKQLVRRHIGRTLPKPQAE